MKEKEKKLEMQENKQDEDFLKYFFTMGKKERKRVINWRNSHSSKTERQREFLNLVDKALKSVQYDYRIPLIEPSLKDGKLYYAEKQYVAVNLNCNDSIQKAKEFAPQYKSRLANLNELCLWYAYRVAMGYCSFEYLCDNVNLQSDSKYRSKIRLSGFKKIAGAKDGIENTVKLVQRENGFALVGKSFITRDIKVQVSRVEYISSDSCVDFGIVVPVVVLRR